MLKTVVSALLPIVVTLALGFFAAWHKDFKADQPPVAWAWAGTWRQR
jgi:malonate transporter and related proteins